MQPLGETSVSNFEEIEEEPAQDAVYNAPHVRAIYRAVHLWWCTMLSTMEASAATDDKQHMTALNDLASVFVGTISVVLQYRHAQTSSKTGSDPEALAV